MKMDEEQSPLDFFAGGVPPFAVFTMNLENIADLLQVPMLGQTVCDLAYIGVVSYTEAFFKDHFASVLNIFPEKCMSLRNSGRDVSVDLTDLLELENPLQNKFGFVLSERFNFGTPKAINALYKDVLLITPYSKDRALAFDRVLAIRNLLVHHGGTLTTKFCRDNAPSAHERTYLDSVAVKKDDVGRAALLALEVIKGTISATVSRLLDDTRGLHPSDVRLKAVEHMDFNLLEAADLESSLTMLVKGESPFNTSDAVTDEDIPF